MAINPQILMTLYPILMQAMNRLGGIREFPNIANALDNGYDPGLMQDRLVPLQNQFANHPGLSGIDVLDSGYTESGIDSAFPSDGASQLELQNLAERLLKYGNNSIGDNGEPALMSAAIMQNNPQKVPPVVDLGGFLDDYNAGEFNDIPGHQLIDPTESDMDEIHQTEMWDSGANFNNPLRNWFKKNKR